MSTPVIDRRRVLAGGGALIVSFSMTNAYAEDQPAPAAVPPPKLPGSLKDAAYREIKEDQHPIVIVSAVDIVNVLRSHGYGDAAAVGGWLDTEFGKIEL